MNNGLTAPFVLSFAANASGDIFAGTYFGNGVFRSTDDGDSWNEKNNGLIATEVRTIAAQGPIPRIHSPNINAADFIFAGTYGRGMFRSTDSGQNWDQIRNGLLRFMKALSLSASSAHKVSSYENVTIRATNPSGHIFAGTYFGGSVFRSTDNGDSWTPVKNGLDCGNIWSLVIIPVGTMFVGTAGCGTGVYHSTDNGDSWTLANIGLTSTDVAALAVNGSNYHVFAGTHSIMGKGGGMFRSTDNGDTWTGQNGGFTARDVNSVVINPIGHIFAGAAGGVFRSMNDADQWSDVSSVLLPPGENVWAVATGGIASEGFAHAGTAGGGVFRKRSIHCRGAGYFETEASPDASPAASRVC